MTEEQLEQSLETVTNYPNNTTIVDSDGNDHNNNKTGTSQVGAISKAQKAKTFVFGKKLEIFEKKILSENVAECRKM